MTNDTKWRDNPDSVTVCYCKNVKKGEIVNAIKNGNNTLVKIQQSTSACTGKECKKMNPSGKCCADDIHELIFIYSANTDEPHVSSCDCCL